MKLRPTPNRARMLLVALSCLCVLSRALAHGPFDISSTMVVYDDRIELTSTLGVDAARRLFTASGLPPEKISEALRARGPDDAVAQPTDVADRFFHVEIQGEPAGAKKMTSLCEGMEIIMTVIYPRPTGNKLEVRAVCYETIPELRKGVLRVTDESARSLGAALFSSENKQYLVALPSKAAGLDASQSPAGEK